MMRSFILSLALLAIALPPAPAAVQVEEKTQVEFPGALGGMMKMFGGKVAREGVMTETTVVGNRMMTKTGDTGQLVDLDEELVYNIDFKKEKYEVMTFAEVRQQMEKAQESLQKMQGGQQDGQQGDGKEYEIEVDIQRTGRSEVKNGFQANNVIMEITFHEKGKTLEEGGMKLISDMWITKDAPSQDEMLAFQQRYLEKIGLTAMVDGQAAGMLAVLQKQPGFQDLQEKFREAQGDLEGVQVASRMEMIPYGDPNSAQGQQQEAPSIGDALKGLGGFGGFGRKKKDKEPEPEPAAQQSAGAGKPLMTTTTDVYRITSDVSADAVQIPAGFKRTN